MWFRRVTGTTLGLLIPGAGPLVVPVVAMAPGGVILGITWLTWSSGR
jgi:hypothetical protein